MGSNVKESDFLSHELSTERGITVYSCSTTAEQPDGVQLRLSLDLRVPDPDHTFYWKMTSKLLADGIKSLEGREEGGALPFQGKSLADGVRHRAKSSPSKGALAGMIAYLQRVEQTRKEAEAAKRVAEERYAQWLLLPFDFITLPGGN